MKCDKNVIFAGLCLLGVIFSGCHSKPDNSKRAEARSLYLESIKMIKNFSDSMAHATDSARIKELSDLFLHDITALNFKYPNETDLEMSEGENDTLINLTERYVFLRDSMLYSFAHPVVINDSIPVDSLVTVK